MKKTTWIYSLLCCMMAQSGHATTATDSIRCDFTGEIPASFTLIDADGNAPSADLVKYDFAVGVPWTPYYIEEENNFVAASTSWYENGGTSSDWMILPPITVKSADDIVAWRAKATDKNYRDGYAVYITEGEGTSVADFDTTQPLFSVATEESEWTHHSVSLAQYVGKTVRIAFVNNSTDCSVLYVDDVFAGTPSTISVQLAMDALVKPTNNVVVKGQVFTDLDTPIKGFTLHYQRGDQQYSRNFPTAEVRPGQPYEFEWPTDDFLPLGEKATVSVWAEHDGQQGGSSTTVRGAVNNVVTEELTGSWCGYCVRGTVVMDEMKQKYPDSFIGLAVHGGDFLQVKDYQSYIYSVAAANGYPSSVVNRDRTQGNDVKYIPYIYKYFANQPIEGGVFLEVSAPSDEQYTATARVVLNQPNITGRYRLAYTLVEDDVYEEGDDRYKQHNSYAGGEQGKMGGFEDLPEYVENYHFPDVVRGSVGDVKGIENSLPAIMVSGKEYVHQVDFTLPYRVLNADNVSLVAMLIDSTTGHIVNADKVSLKQAASGVAATRTTSAPDRTDYYTLDGRKLSSIDGLHGFYIVRETTGGQVKVYKVRK